MSGPERNTATLPHRSALHGEGPGFAVTVLPAVPYQVSYVPAHHVIGFTFERQRGVDAFGGALLMPSLGGSPSRRQAATFFRPRTGVESTWC
jgi:hypothetical protein